MRGLFKLITVINKSANIETAVISTLSQVGIRSSI